jgi:hypothetical protein
MLAMAVMVMTEVHNIIKHPLIQITVISMETRIMPIQAMEINTAINLTLIQAAAL